MSNAKWAGPLVFLLAQHHRPGDARRLVASATATTSGGRRPRMPITHGSALVAFERSKLALAPLIRSRRKYWLPRLDIPPRRCLPPVEFCRGTRPSQEAALHARWITGNALES